MIKEAYLEVLLLLIQHMTQIKNYVTLKFFFLN